MKLAIGAKVYLYDQVEEIECRSQLLDFNEDHIYIAYPVDIETDRTKIIAIGEEFQVSFVDATNVVYSFPTKVIGKSHTTIPALQLAYPEEETIEKIQRREYVRVETPVDVALILDSGEKHQLVTHDISAGGTALYTGDEKIDVEEGEEVTVTVVLPFRDESIVYEKVTAKVIRQFEKDSRPILALQFVELSDPFQGELVRFCFERQLQRRREEKGVL